MWPQVRYALWLIVFIKLIIPPQFSLETGILQGVRPTVEHLYEITIGAQEEQQQATGTTGSNGVSETQEGESSVDSNEAGQVNIVAATGDSLTWHNVPFFLWVIGVGILSGLLVVNITRLRRWHDEQISRKSLPKWFNDILLGIADQLKIERLPAVVFSNEIRTPAVYGFFRPVLLLPKEYLENLSREELRLMTLHELTHLKRNDLIIHGFTTALQILYWFNPFILLANKRMKHVREICCDLSIARLLKDETPRYRTILINAARRLLTESVGPVMGLLGVFEEPYRIISRLSWLERDMSLSKYFLALLSIILVTVFILFIIPMEPTGSSTPLFDSREFPLVGSPEQDRATDTPDDGRYLHWIDETWGCAYGLGIKVESKLLSVEETWMNDHKVILKEDGRRLIVDLKEKTYLFINDITETYIQLPIPIDVSNVYDESVPDRIHRGKVVGEVEETGMKKSVLGKVCREYSFTSYEVKNAQRVNQRTISVWVSNDFPIGSEPLDVALDNRRKLFGATQQVRDEMKKLKGFQMMIDFNPEVNLNGRKLISTTKEIEWSDPPEYVLNIPERYKRKISFSREDF
jgi:bla regulator protein BlaR1